MSPPPLWGGGSAPPPWGEASCELVAAAPARPVTSSYVLLLPALRKCHRVCRSCRRRVFYRFLGRCDGALKGWCELGLAPLAHGHDLRVLRPGLFGYELNQVGVFATDKEEAYAVACA